MSHFNQAANTWDSPEKIQMMTELANRAKKRLSINEKVDILDIGCGTGLFSFAFQDIAKSIYGIDTSSGMLEVFKEKAKDDDNIQCKCLDIENELITKKFDLIISSMAFHHLEKPESLILKLKNNLRNDGKIAIVDLCSEDGTFHSDPNKMGVKHFGFSENEIKTWALNAHMKVEYILINKIEKNTKVFDQFLAIFEN